MKYAQPIIFLIFIFTFTNVYSQNKLKFGERLIYGTSLTYIFHTDESLFGLNFHEFTWDNNLTVNITPALYFGLSYKHIHTRGSLVTPYSRDRTNYFMTNAFLQYDFLPKQKMRLFPEVSWGYGNYCFCGFDDPVKIEGLHYLGLGVGFDYPITKYLSIDIAMTFYNIINEIDIPKGDYNIYTLGLNVDLINQ